MRQHIAMEHETTLLAALLAGANPKDAKHISRVSFYTDRAADIWETAIELTDQGTQLTVETIAAHQGARADHSYLEKLAKTTADPAKIDDYAAQVAEGAARRVLNDTAYAIQTAANEDRPYGEIYDEVLEALENLPRHFEYRDNPPQAPGPLDTAFSSASLMKRKFPPLEYVVPGVITEGLGLIVAPPKLGKSWMMLGVGIACSQGGKAFNAIPVDQRPVLYLALEDGPRRLQDRLQTLGATTGSEDLVFMTDVPAGAMLTIGAFIEQHSDRNPLVILDTLGKARDVFTGNDAYQKDYKELSDYKRLVDQHPGSTLLIVHHTNKGAHGDFVASVSGTQGITGAADSVLTIERGRGEGEATLNVTSRDAAEGSYAMTFDNGSWTLDGTGLLDAAKNAQTRKAITGLGDAMTEVVELVGKHPEGISPKDVAALLHWEPSKARLYLKRAYDENRLAKASRGLYIPVTIDTSVTIPGIESPNSYTVTEVTPSQGEERAMTCDLHGTDYFPECYTCDEILKESA